MSKRPTSAAEAVAKSRARTGTKSVSLALRPDEVALLDEMATAHGGRKGALMNGLRALNTKETGGDPTPAQALRVLARLVKGAA